MLLTSEPGRTFAIGLEGKGLEPERSEPAMTRIFGGAIVG